MAVSKAIKDSAFELYKMLRVKYGLSDRAIAIGLLQLHLQLEQSKKAPVKKDFETYFSQYKLIEGRLKDAESKLEKVELMRDELIKKLDASIPVDALEKHAIKLFNKKPELSVKLKPTVLLRIYNLARERGIIKAEQLEKVIVKKPSQADIIAFLKEEPTILENAYKEGVLKIPRDIGAIASLHAELRKVREEFKAYRASTKTADFYRTNRDALVAAAEAVFEDPELSKGFYKDWVPKIELESVRAELNARIEALQAGIKRLQDELNSLKYEKQ